MWWSHPWSHPPGMQWGVPLGVPLGVPCGNQWAISPEVIQHVQRQYVGPNPLSLFDKYIIANHMHQIFNLMKEKNKNKFTEIQEHFNKIAYNLTNILAQDQIENHKHYLESYIYSILDTEVEYSVEKSTDCSIKDIISYIDKILVGFAAVYEIHFK
jgi:hypothetical protein